MKEIKYKNKGKEEVRMKVLKTAKKQGGTLLDFYGNGEMYRKAKRNGIKIYSIDDGRQCDNRNKLKRELSKLDTEMTSLKDLCNKEKPPKFKTMFIDNCGHFTKDIKETTKVMHKIMRDKGTMYITLFNARETILPKGSNRNQIDQATLSDIQKTFRDSGISTKKIYTQKYNSIPTYKERRKKTGTPMIVLGFEWKLTTN